MLGVVRETPPELILPDNILQDKAPKAPQKWDLASFFLQLGAWNSIEEYLLLWANTRKKGIIFFPNNARRVRAELWLLSGFLL
jgi:hypothetical protein